MSNRFTGIGSFGACSGLIHAFRAGAANCLLAAGLLAAMPLQVMAETPGVLVLVNPAAIGQYSSITEGETATFTVSRTGDNSNALTVTYESSGGGGPAARHYENAVEGEDYTDITTSHIFPAGMSEPHEFRVTINDDDRYEPIEYFTLTVSGSYVDGGNTIEIMKKRIVVRIKENDERHLTLSPVSDTALASHPEFKAKEGGTGNENKLKISLNATLPYELQIPYTVGFSSHTTAATSDDFTMSSGTAKIPIGETSDTIDIKIVDDNRVEPTEYFTLQFGGTTYDNMQNAIGLYPDVKYKYQESKATTQLLSVSIMDNDTALTGGIVYLRGEGPTGPTVIDKFPSTRRTITEGQSTIITAEVAGTAPSSDINIPLKVKGFPSDEVTLADYSIPESITIKSGEKSGSVTLTIKDDSDDERYRELLVVEIDDSTNFPTGYTKGNRSIFEVVMLDNDKTGTKLQKLSTDVLSEDSGKQMATFEIQMDRLPKRDTPKDAPFSGVVVAEGDPAFKLEYSGSDKKAKRSEDFTSPVNVPSKDCLPTGNKLTCTVKFTVKDDELYEGGSGKTENVSIKLKGADWANSDGITNTGSDLKLTIEDNDDQPMLSVGDATATEGGELTFEVTRTGAKENKLSVQAATAAHVGAANLATASSDDKARSDYKTHEEPLEFAKNILKQTFMVTTTQDVIHEMDETLLVKLSMANDTGGEPAPAIADDTGIGTITDDDAAPTALTISVDTDTIAEAAGQTTVSVTASITSSTRFATNQTVTVTVGNADNAGEASKGEGGDYAAVDEFNITIPATEASGKGTFELTPVNDRFDDDDEKISVEGQLTGMTVTHAAITIKDDDTRGITVDPVTLTINEADDTNTDDKEDEDTYEVALTSQPEGGTVTVDIESEGPKVATVHPSSLTFDADNWEMAQTVTVTAKNDTIDDTGDQKTTTITHTVSAADTDYQDETAEDVGVTVRDDDEAPMALTITVDTDTNTGGDQNKIGEGASSPTLGIIATLDGDTQFATDKTITITVGDSDKDTATEGGGGDYNTVNDFDITLPAGAESISHDLTLTLNDDGVDEPDETVTVTGELAGVTVTDTMFTIEDNDPTPTVTLVLTPASINESGATNASTVTATMDGTSSGAVTLTVSATSVSPAVAGDLTLSGTSRGIFARNPLILRKDSADSVAHKWMFVPIIRSVSDIDGQGELSRFFGVCPGSWSF